MQRKNTSRKEVGWESVSYMRLMDFSDSLKAIVK